MSAPDVIVIGAGIVGTATVAFLAEGGARVTLYERAGLASGASGARPAARALHSDRLARHRLAARRLRPEAGGRPSTIW